MKLIHHTPARIAVVLFLALSLGIEARAQTPAISIANSSVIEGNSGFTNMDFQVTLSQPSAQTVTVDYATIYYSGIGSATAGFDFLSTSGTLSFAPGVTNGVISVPVWGDLTPEPRETFYVELSRPVNATLSRHEAAGYIIDDEPLTIDIGDAAINERDGIEYSPGSVLNFKVTLTSTSTQTVTVNFATVDGTAIAGSDYLATNGTLSFAPGVTSIYLPVTVVGDMTEEPDEYFSVVLSNPVNAVIRTNPATGKILNDDFPLSISIANASTTEGDSGIKNLDFKVTLSKTSTQTVAVSYATIDGTATAGSDYLATNGTLSFAPGVTNGAISVQVLGDTTWETDETFKVMLSNPVNGLLATNQATGTIFTDDYPPVVSITGGSITEGDSGSKTLAFNVKLSKPGTNTVTVNYTTADGTATAGSDYLAASGTLSFPVGVTNGVITVQVLGDTTWEPDETFVVTLSNPVNANMNGSQATGTIVNDDPAPTPTISIADASFLEGDVVDPNRVLTFTVTLSNPSTQPVTVNLATTNGTATAGSDYVSTNGVLTIPAGATNRYLTVRVLGDTEIEPDETFFVVLSDPVNGLLGRSQATGTIINDDGGITNAPSFTSQPTNQTRLLGESFSLGAEAAGMPPIAYQWKLAGTNLPGATSPTLTITNATRRDSGVYALVASNPGGSTSSSAQVSIRVPQKLQAGLASDGTLVLTSGYADGAPLSPGDLANFELQASADLVNWTSLTNALVLTNGMLKVADPGSANQPRRFYRMVEH